MMLSESSAARDAKDHEGLVIMVKGCSKPIRPPNVTLFVLLSLIYVPFQACIRATITGFHRLRVVRFNTAREYSTIFKNVSFGN